MQLSFRAPQLADYWRSDTPHKVTGKLQADGSVRIRSGVASGEINLYGQEIAAEKLVVKQLSMQMAIANNRAFLNDLTATMNEKDYVNAHGTVELQKPFRYTGAVTANLADLSTFAPLLASAEKKTPLAGSLVVNWNGLGEAGPSRTTVTSSSSSSTVVMRPANLQANVEAHYTPQELNVPIVFLGSDKLSFQAILRAKDRRSRSTKFKSTRARRSTRRPTLRSLCLEQSRD